MTCAVPPHALGPSVFTTARNTVEPLPSAARHRVPFAKNVSVPRVTLPRGFKVAFFPGDALHGDGGQVTSGTPIQVYGAPHVVASVSDIGVSATFFSTT